MARPISQELPIRDPRAELQALLERAPLEHAEALLAAYEVLQGLHDRGVLEMARGALGSSEKVIEIVVDAVKTPESIRAIRNGLILARALGSVEPEVLGALARSLPEAIHRAAESGAKPPGFWGLLRRSRSRDFRRGLTLATSLLESLGRNLPAGGP